MVINGITKYRAGAPPGLRNPTNIRRENFRGARERKTRPRFMVALTTETLFPAGGGGEKRRREGAILRYPVNGGSKKACVASLPRCLPNYRGLISISAINCIGIRPTRRTKIFHFDDKGREFLSDIERERERPPGFPFARRNLSLT